MITVLTGLPGGQSFSLVIQSLNINLTVYNSVFKPLSLCQDRAIFCDHILAAEHQILSRFPFTGIGIHIAAHQSG